MNSARQSFPSAQNPDEAASQLTYIDSKRSASRQLAAAIWFPLLAGGIASMAAPTMVTLIGGPRASGWYWGFAGPLIGISCGFFYATRPIHLPARIAVASVGIAIALTLGAFLLGLSLGESRAGAPLLAVAAGLGAFGWLYRSPLVGIVAAANLIAAITVIGENTIRAEQTSYLATGFVSCVVGIAAVLATRSEKVLE